MGEFAGAEAPDDEFAIVPEVGGGGGGGSKDKSKGSGRGGVGHVRTSATLLTPGDSGCDDSDADISPETIRDIAVVLSEGGGMRLEY